MTLLLTRRQALAGSLLAVPTLTCLPASGPAHADDDQIRRAVHAAIEPVMKENDIPGMAVAATVQARQYFFNFGVASKESGQKVTEDTIFEIGSISKTFTAILAAYAQGRGALSFSDHASKYFAALAGSSFDRISLLDLGTYTAGGLPLQFPAHVTDHETMIAYYKSWRPAYAAGTHRLYSNPSIGLFGHLAARSLGKAFDDLMEQVILPALGLSRTHIRVPQDRMGDYAFGYSREGKTVRVGPGVLDSEAYGVKTTAAELIHYVEANIDSAGLDEALQRAIGTTQTEYYKAGDMTQGLGWEIYDYPTELDPLLRGNSSAMSLQPNAVTRLTPPLSPRQGVLINKTGSTRGFGAYVAFVPAKRIGVVMLANKTYPNAARVKAAYGILAALDRQSSAATAR